MKLRESIARNLVLAASCVLTGCVVGPKYQAPTVQSPPAYKESPAQFKESGPWTVAQPQDGELRGNWWEIFKDPELNSLESQLNINNQTIKQYFEQFMEARALIREARSQYFPTISTTPAYTRQRSGGNIGSFASSTGTTTGSSGTGSTTGVPTSTGVTTSTGTGVVSSSGQQFSIFSLPIDVSWAPDLWGKVRNEVREYQYSAQVSAADLENERLTEQASLAEYFFELHGQDALLALYAKTVEADKKSLQRTEGLYETGVDDRISVVEAENTLQAAQAAATNIGVLRAQYEHAIAVLVGKVASEFSIPVRAITAAPPAIPIGLPSQLLQRRPDIAAAERTMASANAQIGIAYAAYYPSLTLSASGGFEGSAFSKLLDWSNRFWSIGPSLSETIYEGGLRRATVNQYIATYNADLASYRQTVLTAFQQVEDYLAEVRILSRQIEQEQSVVNTAQTSLKLEMGRYETGVDPYLDVITLQTTLLTDQQTLVNLQVEQMTSAVELIEALGGGWDASKLPTPEQATKQPSAQETQIQH